MSGNNSFRPDNPLIVQSAHTLLLEVHNALYESARVAIGAFADLEKSPEHIHTYRLTPLSLWNAAASGLLAEQISATLAEFAKYPVPQNVLADVHDLAGRWGRIKLLRTDSGLVLESDDTTLLVELSRNRAVNKYLGKQLTPHAFIVPDRYRGVLKQVLTTVGWPVEDLAGYVDGLPLSLELRYDRFSLRDYQNEAADAFYLGGTERGGSGIVVLPCGAGKTIVGLTAMAKVGQSTLVLTTGRTAAGSDAKLFLSDTKPQMSSVGNWKNLVCRSGVT
jgi:DNA excision repair protein ERCC-3